MFRRLSLSNHFPRHQFFYMFRHPDISHVCYFRTRQTFVQRNISFWNVARKILCVHLGFTWGPLSCFLQRQSTVEKNAFSFNTQTQIITPTILYMRFFTFRMEFIVIPYTWTAIISRTGNILVFHVLILATSETSLSIHGPLILPA